MFLNDKHINLAWVSPARVRANVCPRTWGKLRKYSSANKALNAEHSRRYRFTGQLSERDFTR